MSLDILLERYELRAVGALSLYHLCRSMYLRKPTDERKLDVSVARKFALAQLNDLREVELALGVVV